MPLVRPAAARVPLEARAVSSASRLAADGPGRAARTRDASRPAVRRANCRASRCQARPPFCPARVPRPASPPVQAGRTVSRGDRCFLRTTPPRAAERSAAPLRLAHRSFPRCQAAAVVPLAFSIAAAMVPSSPTRRLLPLVAMRASLRTTARARECGVSSAAPTAAAIPSSPASAARTVLGTRRRT